MRGRRSAPREAARIFGWLCIGVSARWAATLMRDEQDRAYEEREDYRDMLEEWANAARTANAARANAGVGAAVGGVVTLPTDHCLGCCLEPCREDDLSPCPRPHVSEAAAQKAGVYGIPVVTTQGGHVFIRSGRPRRDPPPTAH